MSNYKEMPFEELAKFYKEVSETYFKREVEEFNKYLLAATQALTNASAIDDLAVIVLGEQRYSLNEIVKAINDLVNGHYVSTENEDLS